MKFWFTYSSAIFWSSLFLILIRWRSFSSGPFAAIISSTTMTKTDYTRWNDKIVAQEKTTWFHFRLMKTGFLFFVADHLLVCQLMGRCTTHAIYWSKLWQQDHCYHPQKASLNCLRITGTCPWWWKQSFRLRLWSLVWFQVRATSCHLTSSKSVLKLKHQSVPGCAVECGDSLVQSGGRWQNLGMAAGLGAGPQVQRDPGLASEGVLRLCTLLSPDPTPPRPKPRWNNSFGHTSRTSPTWPPTTPKPAWSPPSAELPTGALVEKVCSQFRIRIEAVIEV